MAWRRASPGCAPSAAEPGAEFLIRFLARYNHISLMGKGLFGTDGIRGVPGRFPLDDATVVAAGRALGEFVSKENAAGEPRVLIGMDTRESSPHLAARLAAGLASAGARPVSAGVIPTPAVSALVLTGGFGAGAVISASHNPFTDNGIKLFARNGMKFADQIEDQLEVEILSAARAGASGADALTAAGDGPALSADPRFAAEYLALLRARADGEAKLGGLPIVLDCANGAASRLAPELFASLGARVTALNTSPDGRNINAGCGSLHPEAMRRAVVEQGAQLGVAFDGDADRAVFSTAAGRLVDGDGVLYLMARASKAAGRLRGGAVVGTSMTNLGLERALAREGIALIRVSVGDRYVLEEMLRRGSNLGGEPSGHVIFLDDGPAGDGLATALKLAAALVRDGSLEELMRGLVLFPQRITNVPVAQKPPLDSLPDVARLLEQARSSLGEPNRIVLRYSGTEPLARIMIEAEREAEVARWSAAIADAVRAATGGDARTHG
ncbi:MAG TPA: phosphoglucosamine mutase [Patescibacteria group bacterium]|nr:phosphoglucosamine mutase [Patescibacteria group bacterium]